MSKKQSANVRLVICPKCKKLLLEPTEFLIYACGGCSMMLQAKYYKGDDKTGISIKEPSSSQSQERNHVHSSSMSQNSSSVSEGFMQENGGVIRHCVKGSDLKQLQVMNSGSEASSINELCALQIYESSELPTIKQGERMDNVENGNAQQVGVPSSTGQPSLMDEADETSLLDAANGEVGVMDLAVNRSSILDELKISNIIEPTSRNSTESSQLESPNAEGVRQNSIERGNLEQLVIENSYNLATSASDLTKCGIGQLSPLAVETEEIYNMVDESQLKVINQWQLAGDPSTPLRSASDIDYPDKVCSLEQLRTKFAAGDKNEGNELLECVTEQLAGMNLSISGVHTATEDHRGSSPLLDADDETDKNDGSSLHPCTTKMDSAGVASEQKVESKSGIILDPCLKIENLKNDTLQLMDKTAEEDIGSLPLPEANREVEKNSDSSQGNVKVHLSNAASISKLGRIPKKFPKVRLFNANLWDEVPRNKLPEWPMKSSLAYDGSVSSFEGNDDQVLDQNLQSDREPFMTEDEDSLPPRKWDELNKKGDTSEIQGRVQYYSETLRNMKHLHPSTCISMSSTDDEGTRQVTLRRMKPRREEFPSAVSIIPRDGAGGYGSNSSSSYHSHLIHPPPYKHADHRYGVDRRYIIEHPNKEIRMFSNASGDYFHDVHPHSYHGKGRTGIPYHNFRYIPFSGETLNDYYHNCGSNLCYHCRDVWQSSCLSPLADVDRELFVVRSNNNHPDPYDSFLDSPGRIVDYDSHGSQRHSEHNRNQMNLRKKHQPMLQYIRPVAGGAPFITCYQCLGILHLPADFLPKRSNQPLKCGACSRLLKFTLEKEHHLVPYVQKTEPHLNRVNEDPGSKPVSSYQENDYVPLHEQVSVAINRQKHLLESEDLDKKDIFFKEPHDGASSHHLRELKVSRQPPPRSRSPLHRLMGYSSPNDVLQG